MFRKHFLNDDLNMSIMVIQVKNPFSLGSAILF